MADRLIWILLFVIFVIFLPLKSLGQTFDYSFKPGEYARYGAYYNWNFIWIQSGEVQFRADPIRNKNKKARHFKTNGKTYKAYDLVYEVRDTFETYCNYHYFKPIDSRRVINHGRDNSEHIYNFDDATGKIGVKILKSHQLIDQLTVATRESTYDLLATAYHFRMFDFSKLFVGQKVPYRMLIDRQVDELYFRYLGTEDIKTRTGKKFRCQKVSVYLLQGDFFPEGEYMKIWFTDDKNHLPVQVESKILIGSVKALLLDIESNKYPLNSQIN